ncbi:MAG: M1 family metallopeptidase [Flavobacteriia bacterium]|nr:M1 family metallopeptidase [Flavobacteriia bacterium]OIP48246.1 MAG: aminopeptidase [Flavobacteriaceae bacterium CG2_30_31_66]PIV96636.1 MAG: aminopeptidase [Flavobacteriaceae bacterium CG17_big_fil_post_rev_8_21_14_2_50_31_13]PIX13597.1 MAG: aminopeptidase [Flavobacteriaceae bacterium CG_4_8_14_3_um_filter_31_8]PIY14457.1 MAG: aminopeptidase [Flavobacteriaceae bacterium CG_4_10_14_3_um_filter_31_253]PIZ10044.1 MAG: aminopeptidase [Flavobacteriaceae bacterium CG_4_10_14_0_8_um_filter_31_99]
MKKISLLLFSFFLISNAFLAQETKEKKVTQKGHTDENKFRQMKDLLATPNDQHTASGAPGHQYSQQKVDYVMNIRLEESTNKIYGEEKITYHNNSKDNLDYLWIQLDQNMRADDSKTPLAQSNAAAAFLTPEDFKKNFMKEGKSFGFNIEKVLNAEGKPLSYLINWTMMRINLPKPLAPGEKFNFSIQWNYKINNSVKDGGRSGFEDFPDGNNNYTIAQFFPRLCVYNNVEGWQNMQFWGRSEFALEFGDYDVKITVPSDHIMEATGELQNEKDVLTKEQRSRYEQARKSFNNPVIIVTQAEAEKNEKGRATTNKTWYYKATNVRDFAFATSRKYIWDAMAVSINGKTVMATSLYPKEGNPLWEQHSTRVVANTLQEYSKLTFDYPYPKAVSVHADRQGMEYPMICFNYGRPDPDGTYSERTKNGMIGVITHEVGHNFFPMIVNSDERQWTWMDEGLNSFVEILAELKYDPNFNTGNLPKDIVGYMGGDQNNISPIMAQGDYVKQFGPNAYTKPAAGLYMLRQTIMGPELFDHAFRTYAQRWMFKHPTPEDFFRSMEDASAMDLDWFFRGWFYTTEASDIGIKEVKPLYLTNKPNERVTKLKSQYKEYFDSLGELVYITDVKEDANPKVMENHADGKEVPSFIYSVEFEKPGGLVMPIIVELTYADGTKEKQTFPAQIWMRDDNSVKRVFASTQEIVSIVVDPDLETADVDTSNNSWPKKESDKFDQFKNKVQN